MKLTHLYDHLLIPKELVGEKWREICRAYGEKLKYLHEAAGLCHEHPEGLLSLINRQKTYNRYNQQRKCQEMLDWADLSVEMQLVVLKDFVEDPILLEQLVPTNKALTPITDWFYGVCSGTIEHNKKIVANQYNLAIKARRLVSLID